MASMALRMCDTRNIGPLRFALLLTLVRVIQWPQTRMTFQHLDHLHGCFTHDTTAEQPDPYATIKPARYVTANFAQTTITP